MQRRIAVSSFGGELGRLISRDVYKGARRGMAVRVEPGGHINDFLPGLIEIGVDMINSQVKVVGLDWVAANVRGTVAFRTDIDRQHVMPFASPSQVKEEIHHVFEACGTPDGGIIACGEVGPDVPLENIRAMYEAFWEYGTYR
jgi:uroporphyrinogen decarboxylase